MQDDRRSTNGVAEGAPAAAGTTVCLDDYVELWGTAEPEPVDDAGWLDGATRDPAFLMKDL